MEMFKHITNGRRGGMEFRVINQSHRKMLVFAHISSQKRVYMFSAYHRIYVYFECLGLDT